MLLLQPFVQKDRNPPAPAEGPHAITLRVVPGSVVLTHMSVPGQSESAQQLSKHLFLSHKPDRQSEWFVQAPPVGTAPTAPRPTDDEGTHALPPWTAG